jgi:hypothetical protein
VESDRVARVRTQRSHLLRPCDDQLIELCDRFVGCNAIVGVGEPTQPLGGHEPPLEERSGRARGRGIVAGDDEKCCGQPLGRVVGCVDDVVR